MLRSETNVEERLTENVLVDGTTAQSWTSHQYQAHSAWEVSVQNPMRCSVQRALTFLGVNTLRSGCVQAVGTRPLKPKGAKLTMRPCINSYPAERAARRSSQPDPPWLHVSLVSARFPLSLCA